jgi:hypothetical protein
MPDSPDSPDGVELGYRTLIAFSRALTGWGSNGALREDDGIVLCASGSWIPVVGNCAFRRSEGAVSATELVARADDFFGGLARGYSVKVCDDSDDDLREACTAAGLEAFGESVPEMLCRAPLSEQAPPKGVLLSAAEDEGGIEDFRAVNAEAYGTYGLPADVMGDLFDRPAVLLADPAAHVVVARRRGRDGRGSRGGRGGRSGQGAEAVATAMIYESDGVASVQWVGTVPSARGAGLGALVTAAVTNLAFERGATQVTLQASPMGEPVYLGLGYEPIYRFTEYVRWPKPPGR